MVKSKKQNHYCTFYIVRHGETKANQEGVLQGQSDSPLTEEGIFQAKKAAKKLKKVHFDEAFSSDLLRAKRTAEVISQEHKLIVKTAKLIRERAFGKFEGKKYEEFGDELREAFLKFESLVGRQKFRFKLSPEVESDEEIVVRFITFLREISLAYAGKTILVVSHGGMMRALLIHLGFGTYETLPPGAIQNLGYIKLESDGVDFFYQRDRGNNRSNKNIRES